MDLHSLRALGRSGLLVSPLALGTMTFGTPRWGLDEAGSRAVFDRYVGLGGNVIDTADVYAGGRSEEMVGRFVAEAGLRDRLVIATKSGSRPGGARMPAATARATSAPPSTGRSRGCAPTSSTSTGCMSGTGSPRPRSSWRR